MGNNGTDKVWIDGGQSLYKQDNFEYIKMGRVVSIKDEYGMGRIKVRVYGNQNVGGDNNVLDKDLGYAFPLIPKHLSVIPKVGEMVYILVMGRNKQSVDRFYFGPVISQLNKLDYDDFDSQSAQRPFTFAARTPDRAVTSGDVNDFVIPELIGVFPKADEVSIQGRYNTDITQKRNEVVIRAGKFEPTTSNEFNIQFNYKTQAFIQIKNDVTYPNASNPEETERGTITNIVANKINLLTHKDGSPIINLNNQNLINDEEMKKIFSEAHQLPFGDILLEYLKLLKNAIFSHVHNGNGGPATDLASSGNVQAIGALKAKAEDLESRMLSKNIRIN